MHGELSSEIIDDKLAQNDALDQDMCGKLCVSTLGCANCRWGLSCQTVGMPGESVLSSPFLEKCQRPLAFVNRPLVSLSSKWDYLWESVFVPIEVKLDMLDSMSGIALSIMKTETSVLYSPIEEYLQSYAEIIKIMQQANAAFKKDRKIYALEKLPPVLENMIQPNGQDAYKYANARGVITNAFSAYGQLKLVCDYPWQTYKLFIYCCKRSARALIGAEDRRAGVDMYMQVPGEARLVVREAMEERRQVEEEEMVVKLKEYVGRGEKHEDQTNTALDHKP